MEIAELLGLKKCDHKIFINVLQNRFPITCTVPLCTHFQFVSNSRFLFKMYLLVKWIDVVIRLFYFMSWIIIFFSCVGKHAIAFAPIWLDSSYCMNFLLLLILLSVFILYTLDSAISENFFISYQFLCTVPVDHMWMWFDCNFLLSTN